MKWIAVFPGQGSQHVGMGKDLSACEELWAELDRETQLPISSTMFHGPSESLTKTSMAQPAIMAVSFALFQALRQRNWPLPIAYAGHSLGEYSALCAAGALTFAQTARLLKARGQGMESVPIDDGAMGVILNMPYATVADLAKESSCFVANDNSLTQVVISGRQDSVDECLKKAKDLKAKTRKLDVSGPFHSPLMERAATIFQPILDSTELQAPHAPLVTNISAQGQIDPWTIKKHLLDNITSTVRWTETMEHLISLNPDAIIDIGPGSVLAGLLKRTSFSGKILSVSCQQDVDSLQELLTTSDFAQAS